MRLLCVILLLSSLTACTTFDSTVSAYRNSFTFSTINSYSTYQRNSDFSNLQNLPDSTRNTIEIAIERNFDAKGFEYKPLEQADIIVTYYLIERSFEEFNLYNREINFCSYCLRSGQNTRVELEKSYRAGSLVLDILDPKNKSSVWRSVHRLKISEKDNSRDIQEKINAAVSNMFNTYPQAVAKSALLKSTNAVT